jgi:hypothetical protein
MTIRNLDFLFKPKSVAMAGASRLLQDGTSAFLLLNAKAAGHRPA